MTPTAGTLSPHRQYHDHNSASNFNDFPTKHLSLDWNVDFDKSVIQGRAKLSIKVINPSAPQIKLDGIGLDIKSVSSNGLALPFCGDQGQVWGCHLHHCTTLRTSFPLVIDYETTNQCSAVQWLKPEQTSGGKHPYLFTQCQAILARSMLVPCQDTPAVKSTFDARVTVPSPLTAVMGANQNKGAGITSDGYRTFYFEQTTPIPVINCIPSFIGLLACPWSGGFAFCRHWSSFKAVVREGILGAREHGNLRTLKSSSRLRRI